MLISAKIKDIYEGSKSTYNDQSFKRSKNLVWLVKNVGIVKLEEVNQLMHKICAMFTRKFF